MYKKIITTITIVFFSIFTLLSQNHIEALRYSQQFYSSTAKSEAMGNSLSAVGADFSAFMINPAGIAIYKSKQFAFTSNFIASTTEGNLSGTSMNDGRIGMNLSNVGYAGIIRFDEIVKTINFGFNYNSYNDFRQQTYVYSNDQESSILDFVLYNENNDRYNMLGDLAYYGDLFYLDTVSNSSRSFVTDDGTYGVTQKKLIRTNGGAGEYSFTLGANISDILYIGTTVGMTAVSYTYESTYTEDNFPTIWGYNPENLNDSSMANPDEIIFNETLYTTGEGINAKFGIIIQPVKFLRIGAAIHTPTIYDFSDDYSASMYSHFPVADEFGNFDIENDDYNLFEWKLKTPLRANAGIALFLDSYKLGKFYTVPMTFSFDYEFVDYSSTQLKSSWADDFKYDFFDENKNIETLYKESHNFRTGAELNFGVLKIRAGYAIYSSPYIEDSGLFENAKSIYSGGFGFAKRHTYFDLSYSYSLTNETLNLYNATDIYPNDPIGTIDEPKASLSNKKQFFKATLGFRF